MATPPKKHPLRALAGKLHPSKVWHRLRHLAHRMGYYQVRLWVIAFDPRRVRNTVRWALGLRRTLKERQAEERLTVAVDVSALWEPLTGIGFYLYRLLEHLAERDDLRLRLYGPPLVDKGDVPAPRVELPRGPALEWISYRVPEDLSFVHYWLADRLRARSGRLIAADGNAVVFAPNFMLPPWFARCGGRLVATVHDLGVYRVPETLRDSTRRQLEAGLHRTLERACRVITDSETVRGELIGAGLVSAERVEAIHLGPGSVATAPEGPPPAGTPERYVLFVGTREPRKNLPVLFAAWRELHRRGEEPPPLVLCGGRGWKMETLEEELTAAADGGWLYHFGYLPDAEVAALYRGAELVVLPSLYEGFGLPVVEAMGCGTPLLCADIPVLREVAGEAALYAPPDDSSGWADRLAELLADPGLRAALVERGQKRRGLFDWRETAERTVEVWRAAAGKKEAPKEKR